MNLHFGLEYVQIRTTVLGQNMTDVKSDTTSTIARLSNSSDAIYRIRISQVFQTQFNIIVLTYLPSYTFTI